MNELYLEKHGEIAVMMINRPDKRNAISYDMWLKIPELAEEVEADDEVKVLIIRGAGDKAFAAGADISEFKTLRASSEGAKTYNRATNGGERAIANLSKPTIAMIHGFCIGGGCGLAVACDFRFADSNGRLGITPAKLGLVYTLTATKQLVDLVGPATAKYMLFSGLHLDVGEASRVGLVDRVLMPEALEPATLEFAEAICSRAQFAVRSAKTIIRRISQGQTEDDEVTTKLRNDSFDTPDYREGVQAFIEKRSPRFGQSSRS